MRPYHIGVALLLLLVGTAFAQTANKEHVLKWFDYVDRDGCFVAAGDQVRPVLPLIVSADGIVNIKHSLIIEALKAAISRGCDINQPDITGLSPLNTAILQGNVALVGFLLEAGADWQVPIKHADNQRLNGLNSIGFVELMKQLRPERFKQKNMQDIERLLVEKQKTSQK